MSLSRIGGLFPGQGSQLVGMGKEIVETYSEARAVFSDADKELGFSLSALCFNGPLEVLTLTQNAQPAILVTSFACFLASKAKLAAAAGHSLGEYTALVAANVLSFADAVQLVHKRGRYMQEAVPQGEGKMVAALGSIEEEVIIALREVGEGIAEVANLNCPGQTVIAGDVEGIDAFSAIMKNRGLKVVPLNVSAPFHCRLMNPAAERLARDLDAITFSTPSFPVYANFTGLPVASGEQARELLKKQVCGTVRWTDCMVNMLEREKITQCFEFGAGSVLANLLRRIQKGMPCRGVSDAASVTKVKEPAVSTNGNSTMM